MNDEKSFSKTSINWEITTYGKLPQMLILQRGFVNCFLHF